MTMNRLAPRRVCAPGFGVIARTRRSICLAGSFFTYFLPSPVLGPLAIYFCVRGLKDKNSRGETDGIGRLYLLIVLSLFVSLGGVLFYVAMFGAFRGTN